MGRRAGTAHLLQRLVREVDEKWAAIVPGAGAGYGWAAVCVGKEGQWIGDSRLCVSNRGTRPKAALAKCHQGHGTKQEVRVGAQEGGLPPCAAVKPASDWLGHSQHVGAAHRRSSGSWKPARAGWRQWGTLSQTPLRSCRAQQRCYVSHPAAGPLWPRSNCKLTSQPTHSLSNPTVCHSFASHASPVGPAPLT